MVDEFEKIFDLSFDMLAILDLNGKFKSVNQTFTQTLGWSLDDLGKIGFLDLILPTGHLNFSNINQNLAKGHPLIFIDSQIKCLNGDPRLLRWTAYPDLEAQTIFLIIREAKTQEAEKEIFKLAVDSSPTVIFIISNGEIRYANLLSEMVFGYKQSELIGKPVEILVPSRAQAVHQSIRDHYEQQPYLRLMGTDIELTGQRSDGTEFPLDIGLNPVQTTDGLVVVCSVIDMTKRKAARIIFTEKIRQLEGEISVLDKLSLTDELTSVSNRRALFKQFELQYRIAQKETQPLSFLLLDIDDFKKYNDTLGHIAGDKVLKLIAEIMTKSVRRTEIVARYGGEEFGMILPATDASDAKLMAERLRKMIEKFKWPLKNITVSIGTATLFPKTGQTIAPDEINNFIIKADKALYFSKQSGKNKVTHFNDLVIPPEENLSNWKIQHETPTDH
jgi:diguanylate cyclase (GGDEF)-like protein/PAS domain S-box-containing protein